MPALDPDYRCRACNGSHTLYYAGIGAVPDLSKPWYFTCSRSPVAMRVTAGDRWKPVRVKLDGALEVICGDRPRRGLRRRLAKTFQQFF